MKFQQPSTADTMPLCMHTHSGHLQSIGPEEVLGVALSYLVGFIFLTLFSLTDVAHIYIFAVGDTNVYANRQIANCFAQGSIPNCSRS